MKDNREKVSKALWNRFSRICDTESPRYVKCRYPDERERLEVIYDRRDNKIKKKM